jgi:general nucleoside transport system permease protein
MMAAILGGAGLALIFALLTQVLMANQVASGLALTLFGLGFSALVGQGFVGVVPPRTPKLTFGHCPTCRCWARSCSAMTRWSMSRSHGGGGLVVPELHPRRAHPARGGRKPRCRPCAGLQRARVRVLAIAFGGACAGLGGAYLSA